MSFSARRTRISQAVLALNPGLKADAQVAVHARNVLTVAVPESLLSLLPRPAVGPATWRAHLATQDRKIARLERWSSEHKMQVALIRWSRAEVRANRLLELALLYAVPNGGQRNARTAAMLQAEGVRPGIPDLALPVPHHGHHGAYLELKLPTNRPTDGQEAWLDALESYGYKVGVAFSLAAAKGFLTTYLTP